MRSIALSSSHYAARWPAEVTKTPAELTGLGIEFAALAEGEAKEAKLLEILQCFHGYLQKYVSMILRGHLPLQRQGRSKEVNADTKLLLRCFIPRDQAANRATLGAACRTLHLAFKGMSPDEVYDQLMMCLCKSIRRYDPKYSDKVKATVEVIDGALKDKKLFTNSQVTELLGYPAVSYLRVLVKRGFLMPLPMPPGVENQYGRSENWPVPESLFQNGAVGLSYVASKWFRYFLVDFIHWRMSELEAKEGLVQLNHHTAAKYNASQGASPADALFHNDRGIPSLNGNLTNPRSGRSAAVDMTLTEMPVDIGHMTLEWVNEGKPGLFEDLSKRDRHLLYCVFVRDMDWESIASTFSISAREVKRWYTHIMENLRAKVGLLRQEESDSEAA